jgi:hypothetical protein
MRELDRIVLTACLTLGGGVVLLIITQIFTRFVVDPLVDFRRLLGEVAYTLILNSNLLFNASQTAGTSEFQEARQECRTLASRLHAFSAAVPLYHSLSRIGLVPCHGYVYDAAAQLIGLSNTTATTPPDIVRQRYERISKLLRIRTE